MKSKVKIILFWTKPSRDKKGSENRLLNASIARLPMKMISMKKKGELIKWQIKQRNNFFGIFTIGKIDSKLKDRLNKIKVQVWEMK